MNTREDIKIFLSLRATAIRSFVTPYLVRGLFAFLRRPRNKCGVTVFSMGCFVVLLLAMTLMTTSAQAQDKYGVCKLLPKHTSTSDVTYQAGVDAHGNAVVPADLNAQPMTETLDVVRVPLDVNLAQNVAALQEDGIQLEAPLGMLDIHQDGRILYNGQDWTAPVLTLCGESHKIVTEDTITPPIVEPIAPIAPEFNEAAEIAKPELPNNLAVTGEIEMPAVSAPVVETITRPKVSQPTEPIRPLIGIPKGTTEETSKIQNSDIIKGQDHRDYNE